MVIIKNIQKLALIFLFMAFLLLGCQKSIPNLQDVAADVCDGGTVPNAMAYAEEGDNITHKAAFAFLNESGYVVSRSSRDLIDQAMYDEDISPYPTTWMASRKKDLELVVCITWYYERTGEDCGLYETDNGTKNYTGLGVTQYYTVQIIEARTGRLVKDLTVSDSDPNCPLSLPLEERDSFGDSVDVPYSWVTEEDVISALLPILGPYNIEIQN